MPQTMPKIITSTAVENHLPAKTKRIEVYDERRGWGYRTIELRGPMTSYSQVTTINRGGVVRLYGPQGY